MRKFNVNEILLMIKRIYGIISVLLFIISVVVLVESEDI